MTSASHVATGVTEATNTVMDTVPDKQVPARMALTSSQDQQMGPNLVQVQHTVESEQNDLSDDEFSVLEVQLKQSGEFSKAAHRLQAVTRPICQIMYGADSSSI